MPEINVLLAPDESIARMVRTKLAALNIETYESFQLGKLVVLRVDVSLDDERLITVIRYVNSQLCQQCVMSGDGVHTGVIPV